MKKLSTLFLLFVLCHGFAVAKPISENEALSIAENFFGQSRNKSAQLMTLAETSAGYYIFNRGENAGFVIVAADDRAENEVLGYVENGSFNQSEIPPALRYWLGEYDRQMSQASLLPQAANKNKSVVVRENIAPLVKTHWDQDYPFNKFAPQVDVTGKGNLDNCLTGCVATAMSQIINCLQLQPNQSTSHSYFWNRNDGSESGTLSVDFAGREYNWNLMLNDYVVPNTEEELTAEDIQQYDAVAQLMYDAGVSVNMRYGYAASSAHDYCVQQALVEHFGVDPSAYFIKRDYYDLQQWSDLLYAELAEAQPVFYSAQDLLESSGHAFICDGYRDGYFHINWGWGSYGDGYYMLSALEMLQCNLFSSNEEIFTTKQVALVGLKKAEIGSQSRCDYYFDGDFGVKNNDLTFNDIATFTSNKFFCFTAFARELVFGLKVVSADGSRTTSIFQQSDKKKAFDYDRDYSQFDISLMNFPSTEGIYRVYPMCRDITSSKDYMFKSKVACNVPYLLAEVNDGNITFSEPDIDVVLPDIQLSTPTKAYAGKNLWVEATFGGVGQSSRGKVCLKVLDKDDNVLTTSRLKEYEELPEQTSEMWFEVGLPKEVGEYQIVAYSNDNVALSEPLAIDAVEASNGPTQLEFEEFTVENSSAVDPDNVRVHARVRCTSGYYDNFIYFEILQNESDYVPRIYSLFRMVTLGEGDVIDIELTGAMATAKAGSTYQAFLRSRLNNDDYIPAADKEKAPFVSITFKSDADPSNQTSVEKRNAQQPKWLVYDIVGRLLCEQTNTCLQHLPKGVYILRSENGETSKVRR